MIQAKNKPPVAAATQGLERTASPDYRRSKKGGPDHKVFSSLQAEFALRGYSLDRLNDGSFLAGRWGLSRVLPDFAALIKLAKQIGASA